MSAGIETLAFLHAHGLDVEPEGLLSALRSAVEAIEARYPAEPGREGLTEAEAAVARSGGLEPQPARGAADPLVQGVVALAGMIHTGLTTREAANRLDVSDARIRQRVNEHSLLAIRDGRTWRVPLFQLEGGGELPGWAQVCRALPMAASPVAVERWLSLPHPDLVTGEEVEPVSPRGWLIAGRPPDAVAALAGELA
jgi:excisionase family DNA binding protein